MKISYVIPCYNSESSINKVVNDIFLAMSEMKISTSQFEIICVDDYSKDKTLDIIQNLAIESDNVKCISLSKNFGQDSALLAGLRESIGEFVVTLDDDGQNSPFEVKKMLNALEMEDIDLVFAKYNEKKHSSFRNLSSKINDYMLEKMINKPKDLYVGSFIAVRRYVVNQVIIYENPFPYLRGLLLQSTARVKNVDVQHMNRKIGQSTYTFESLFKLWVNGCTSFSVKPLRLSLFFGLVASFFSFCLIIYAVIQKILVPSLEMGWTSTFCAISFFGGIILFSFGIIGEYVGRSYLCLNKNPQYVIRSVTEKKFNK